MKLAVVYTVTGILSGIKINKISDKEVKNSLLADYLALRKIVKSVNEDKQELIDKFQSDWKDEISAVRELRSKKEPVEGHDEYLKAEAEANLILHKMDEVDAEVTIQPIKVDEFVASVSEEELAFEQVAILLDNGILEE
jgi:hypothetical protein